MLRLLNFLWSGCFHTWKATSESKFETSNRGVAKAKGPCVYAVCTKCGSRKMFKHSTLGE